LGDLGVEFMAKGVNLSGQVVEEIKRRMGKVELGVKVEEVGRIERVGDGVVEASGLTQVGLGELLEFEGGTAGLAFNLGREKVGVVVLGDYLRLRAGQLVKRTGRVLEIRAGEGLIGRVVDPLGNPLDGGKEITRGKGYPLEKIAPGIMLRQPVSQPLYTGIKAIDAMIPVGLGQRELIIGDRGTGKSAIPMTTVMNQKGKDVVCIYVAVGQKASFVAQLVEMFNQAGAMDYTVVVAAPASAPAALQYLAPYAGCALGEYYMDQGRHALVIYDDLTKHAWAYREISLLMERPSGREAYPGDIFYLHSRLLERACKLSDDLGAGSLTALPIIETQAGDVSAYIPTNVISITDGQIYLEPDLFNAGIRPAINVGLSVSRVGGDAQPKIVKQIAGKLRLGLAQYRELAAFSQFASDLDEKTRAQLDRGVRITEVLKQGWEEPYSMAEEVVVLWAVTQGAMDEVPVDKVKGFESALVETLRTEGKELVKEIEKEQVMSDKLEKKIRKMVDGVVKMEVGRRENRKS
jgi:F-type H+-transporting ATPase subunit alpha